MGDLVRRKFGLDDEVVVGEAVESLTLIEEFFGGFLAAGERAFLAGVADVEPAMVERRLEPDAFVAALFDQVTIVGNSPGAAAERTGGRLLRRGEISPGYPFAYLADPDGYEIEIWYE